MPATWATSSADSQSLRICHWRHGRTCCLGHSGQLRSPERCRRGFSASMHSCRDAHHPHSWFTLHSALSANRRAYSFQRKRCKTLPPCSTQACARAPRKASDSGLSAHTSRTMVWHHSLGAASRRCILNRFSIAVRTGLTVHHAGVLHRAAHGERLQAGRGPEFKEGLEPAQTLTPVRAPWIMQGSCTRPHMAKACSGP